ncbi:MAG TPA: transglycosylase domain-containing protein [Chloroflexota bacterium]|nr:transglycosylase domain-containing protein [Chloroflexota bacterium]
MRVQSVRWKIARRHLNQPSPHRLRWIFALVLVLLLLLTGAGGAGAMYFVSRLPSIDRFHVHYTFQDARFYDSQGHLLYQMADLSKRRGGQRIVEPLQDRGDYRPACRGGTNRIPLVLQNATIATEDATFYTNPGFDFLSIVRAAYDDLTRGHIVSGASTITQQVVRANLLNDKQTFSRKAQEVALAYLLSKRLAKQQILAYYLNSVPYGNTAVGAEAGAEVYFRRPVCSIDLAQAALLAGLPQAPTTYDPVRHRAAAMARLREVLTLMRRHGYIRSRRAVNAVLAEARTWSFSPPSAPMRYPQFVRYALAQIRHMPRFAPKLYQGIDIYTTLDPRLQNLAQTLVTNQINSLVAQHVTDGALVSLDLRPRHYGWILSMVGSAHYGDQAGQINMAVSPRQPGSSMKPFNYIYAFQHGAGPGTTVMDTPIQLPDPSATQNYGWYTPANYDHQFHGQLTLRQALANSLNVPAVKVEYYITGSAHVAQTAARFGMTSLYKDNPGLGCNACYSVTLGGLARGTRLLEETAAYGVFASGGLTVPPTAIWKIVQRSTGTVLFCSADCPRGSAPPAWVAHQRRRVLDAGHAYEMTNVLSDNSARCTIQVCEFGLSSPLVLDHPSAAKTGTTNDWTDNWTVGYTPQLITGVWVGNADRSAMINVIGITGAAPIWQSFMEGAFSVLKLPPAPFVAPSNVTYTNHCRPAQSAPGVTYSSFGVNDLYVIGDQLPLCALPERGAMPVSCAQYPQPLPQNWACLNLTGYSASLPSRTYPTTGTTSPP